MKKLTLLVAVAAGVALGLVLWDLEREVAGKEPAVGEKRGACTEAVEPQSPAGLDLPVVSRSADHRQIGASSVGPFLIEVVDRGGATVAGAHAFWQSEGVAWYLGTSDESGGVAGPMIAPGGQGAIIAWHQTRGAGTLEVLAGQTTRAPLRVSIDPFATVTGRVELPAGIEVGDLDLILHVDAVDSPSISDLEPTPDAARSRADASRPEVGLHAI